MTGLKRFRSLLAGASLAAALGLVPSMARAEGPPIPFPIPSGSPLNQVLPGMGGLPGAGIGLPNGSIIHGGFQPLPFGGSAASMGFSTPGGVHFQGGAFSHPWGGGGGASIRIPFR